jgi:hypothetical protein
MFKLPRYLFERFLISIILGNPDYRHLKATIIILFDDIKILLYTGYTVEELTKRK